MKCNECLNLLGAYLDGEANERQADQVRAHLTTCAQCENQFEALTAENEIYARYDREIQISPAQSESLQPSTNRAHTLTRHRRPASKARSDSGLSWTTTTSTNASVERITC